jgi:thiol-disulfide isomerase/thioredoxin
MISGGICHQGVVVIPVEPLAESSIYDISPGGQVSLVQGDDAVVNLALLFPRLPADSSQMENGWEDQTSDHSRIEKLKAAASTRPDEIFSLTRIPVGGIMAISRRGAVGVYQIDIQRGLVTSAQQTSKDINSDRPSNGTIELISSEQIDPALTKAIAETSSLYLDSVGKYKSALAGGDVSAITAAQADLSKQADWLTSITWNDGIATKFGLIEKKPPGLNAMAPDPPGADKLPDEMAADWTTMGYDGKTHAMKEFRGKVVVMDFWYRDCPWCIREMPQLVQLAADFKDKPVEIIGMNVDADPRDAQFVIDTMRLPYLNVKAADIVKSYPFAGGPTLIFVDRDGAIRDRIAGYDALGYEEIKDKINALLK